MEPGSIASQQRIFSATEKRQSPALLPEKKKAALLHWGFNWERFQVVKHKAWATTIVQLILARSITIDLERTGKANFQL